jgi:hypothetical protein
MVRKDIGRRDGNELVADEIGKIEAVRKAAIIIAPAAAGDPCWKLHQRDVVHEFAELQHVA